MGYYVHIRNSTAVIPKENLNKAYDILCNLNNQNDRKSGGGWPQPKDAPKNKPHKGKWFSWMPWDYHKQCDDADEIIQHLRFDTHIDPDTGDLHITGFDCKCGDEEIFFESIAHLMTGYMEWQGEEGEIWRWNFSPAGMEEQYAELVWK